MAFTRTQGVRLLRIAFQLVLIGYLGLVNGDLISQALLVGWAENGMAWRFAPGLLLLVAAALLVPLVAGKQIYCHQLCPHGAAQQLLKNRLPQRWRLGALNDASQVILRALPFLLLLFVLVVAVRRCRSIWCQIEPFDAYLWSIAGWGTLTVAGLGLLASLFVPMAYCRFGCPTVAVLNFLRFNSSSDQLTRRDAAAVLLLAAAGLGAVAAHVFGSGRLDTVHSHPPDSMSTSPVSF